MVQVETEDVERVAINKDKIITPILKMMILLLLKAPGLLGWAKPVSLNYRNLKSPIKDIPLVCLVGPAFNILLAFFPGLWGMRTL